jgi:hypothetical protein
MKILKSFFIVVIAWILILSSSFYLNCKGISVNDHTIVDINQDGKENWLLLISGGDDEYIGDNWHTNTTIKAYNTFKQLGYDDEHIYYIDDCNMSREGVDAIGNKSTVKMAITEWLSSKSDELDNCCIYFNGHGGFNITGFPIIKEVIGVVDEDNIVYEITSEEFSNWVDNIVYNTLTIVFDTCFAGNFIDDLSKENRIIITASSRFWVSIGDTKEGNIFSYHFLDKLSSGGSYGDAWEYADQNILLLNFPYLAEHHLLGRIFESIGYILQNPQIDDNGDGIGHGRNFKADKLPMHGDGNLALSVYP